MPSHLLPNQSKLFMCFLYCNFKYFIMIKASIVLFIICAAFLRSIFMNISTNMKYPSMHTSINPSFKGLSQGTTEEAHPDKFVAL